jgi:undecaprenyl diphosphate synthase
MIKLGRIEISERDIEENLWINEPVDLIIRTGGYSRVSNFLIWQASYSELFVTKILWPDFRKRDLIRAIKWFNSVKRNFGK